MFRIERICKQIKDQLKTSKLNYLSIASKGSAILFCTFVPGVYKVQNFGAVFFLKKMDNFWPELIFFCQIKQKETAKKKS